MLAKGSENNAIDYEANKHFYAIVFQNMRHESERI